ncbi:MAG: SAVED domain-containing protein [Azonexus sp.]|nr:SAVED domain-containing protein [Azonexus sp.]
MAKQLPALADMRGGEISAFRTRCKELVDTSTKGLVSRAALEQVLVESAPSVSAAWLATATELELIAQGATMFEDMTLDVSRFSGASRGALGAAAWGEFQRQLTDFGDFLQGSRARRALRLSAKQRMSLACVVGYALSATHGFTLQMDHNGQVFDTASHERAGEKFFELSEVLPDQAGDEGVASISFPYPGKDDVLAATARFGLDAAPKLFLAGSAAVTDINVLNTAVNEAKAALVAFRSRHRLQRVHLFVKAPSVFAMALGHRLNGVGVVQLYDWVEIGYQQTGELR